MPLFWQSTSETGPLSTCQLILAPVRMLSVDARAITGLNGYQPSAVFLLDFMGFTSIYYYFQKRTHDFSRKMNFDPNLDSVTLNS